MVLEVANLICFLQGYLALTSGREQAHDVIPWPDRWAWRHLTRRRQLLTVHVRVVPLVEAGVVRAQRPLTSGLGLGGPAGGVVGGGCAQDGQRALEEHQVARRPLDGHDEHVGQRVLDAEAGGDRPGSRIKRGHLGWG